MSFRLSDQGTRERTEKSVASIPSLRPAIRPHLLTILTLFLLTFSTTFAQQDDPYLTEQFPFVQYDQNKILYPGSPNALDKLFEKVDATAFEGKGQIQVVHIGGSHIQADMWSDRMRQRLQTFYPGSRGARGLIFPYKMARTNNPYNYIAEYTGTWDGCRNVQRKRACTLGLTGMSVTTQDTFATIRIKFREDYPQYEFNRVRIFHAQDSSSYDIRVANPGINARLVVDPFLGYTEFQLDQYATVLDLEVRKTHPSQRRFALYGISLDNDDPGFVYNAIGVNGAATPSYLRCRLFGKHMKAIKPDLVVFSIGINDAHVPSGDFNSARYERNYDTLVSWVRAANPDCAILFTTNNDSYYKKRYPNRNAEKVRKVMKKLAQKHDAVVWDMYGVMGGLGSVRTWIKAGLANPDRIHMLKPGYVLLADLMFNALMREYDRHLQAVYRNESQHR
ncbi:MAG: GDSL-type esterase/lipase family protein [Bacteroidota bacterium]